MILTDPYSVVLLGCLCSKGSLGWNSNSQSTNDCTLGTTFSLFIKCLDYEPIVLCIHGTYSNVPSIILQPTWHQAWPSCWVPCAIVKNIGIMHSGSMQLSHQQYCTWKRRLRILRNFLIWCVWKERLFGDITAAIWSLRCVMPNQVVSLADNQSSELQKAVHDHTRQA